MISVYSVISAVLFFNIALVIVFVLRRNTEFLVRYSVSVLLLLTGLSILRLFAPIDLPNAIVIASDEAFPVVESFLTTPLSPSHPWLRPSVLLLDLWAGGSLIFGVRDIVSLVRSGHQRRYYRPVDRPEVQSTAAELGISAPVVVTPAVAVPCAGGVFHPVIYFPDIDLSEEERAYILRHERQHIRGRDSLIKVFFFLLRDLFWWNPVLHFFLRDLDAMLEMRCDAKVTADMDRRSVNRYLGTILSYAEGSRAPDPDPSPAETVTSSLAGVPSEVQQRFEILFHLRKRRPWYIRGLVYALVMVAFLASYMVILQPTGLPEPAEMGSSIMVNTSGDNGSYIEHVDGRYIVYFEGMSGGYELSGDELNLPPFNEMPIIERNDTP